MALIKCKECENSVSDTAQFCPRCGAKVLETPISAAFKGTGAGASKALAAAFLLLLLAILSASFMACSDDSKKDVFEPTHITIMDTLVCPLRKDMAPAYNLISAGDLYGAAEYVNSGKCHFMDRGTLVEIISQDKDGVLSRTRSVVGDSKRTFWLSTQHLRLIITETEQASPATLPHTKPEQFATVKDILEDIGMYSVTNNTLEIVAEKPLHIRVSPIVIASDKPDAIDEELRRTIIYSTYRAFLHTGIDQIKVTALPLERMPKPKASKLLASPEYELTITRTKATEVAQQQLKIKTLNDLVIEEDAWAKAFSSAVLKDYEPGLDKFSGALGIKLIKSAK